MNFAMRRREMKGMNIWLALVLLPLEHLQRWERLSVFAWWQTIQTCVIFFVFRFWTSSHLIWIVVLLLLLQYESHEVKVDPEHAGRHRIEEEVAAATAVGAGGYGIYEHHEMRKAHKGEGEYSYEAEGHKKHSWFWNLRCYSSCVAASQASWNIQNPKMGESLLAAASRLLWFLLSDSLFSSKGFCSWQDSGISSEILVSFNVLAQGNTLICLLGFSISL